MKVYSLIDGHWVKDLEFEEAGGYGGFGGCSGYGVYGSESIVAAQWDYFVVTIWSSKEEMGWLHSFDARNYDDMKKTFVENIKVTGNKVVLLLTRGKSLLNQLVVLQEGENNWEIKILEPFSITILGKLAVDKDWLAVAGYGEDKADQASSRSSCGRRTCSDKISSYLYF